MLTKKFSTCLFILMFALVSGDSDYEDEYDNYDSSEEEIVDSELTADDFAAAAGYTTRQSANEDGTADDYDDDDDEDPIYGGDAYEGDIIFPEGKNVWWYVNQAESDDTLEDDEVSHAAVKSEHNLWPNGVIPYVITGDIPMDDRQRQVISEAILEYTKHTCIKWKPRRGEVDYVRIINGKSRSGCKANVGKLGGGQRQILNLGPRCFRKGTVVHEMMHAAGFFHEQSRTDRDDYVTIQLENLKNPKHKRNFHKYSLDEINLLRTEYDCGSIMHYSPTAFAKGGTKTIIPKTDKCKNIGQRLELSPTDIKDLNHLYKCDKRDKDRVSIRNSDQICHDAHSTEKCENWEKKGYCDQGFMKMNCRKTCKICTES